MENKHQAWDLAQMQALPLSAKIRMTQDRIRGWYENYDGNVYVAVSGGKDSQVLAHLVKEMYPDVPCVFVNTGLEYDSVRKKGIELADEVLRPEMQFVDVIKKYGYPIISKEVAQSVDEARRFVTILQSRAEQSRAEQSRAEQSSLKYAHAMADFLGIDRRIDKNNKSWTDLKMGVIPSDIEIPQRTKQIFGIDGNYTSMYSKVKYQYLLNAPFKVSAYCCNVMKKRTSHSYSKQTNRVPFIGTMASESRLRKSAWIKHGCNAFNKTNPSSQPLSFWTEQDILAYIVGNGLDIADVYGDVVYRDKDGYDYDNAMFIGDMELSLTGVKRTGCVFCMFGITQDTERFLKLKEVEPKKYNFVMNGGEFDESGMWIPNKQGLGYKFVIDWLNEHGNLNIKY